MAPPSESRASQKPSPIFAPAGPSAAQVNLSARLISVAEEERKHLARELHDDIGQRLSLLAVSLDILKSDEKAEDSIRAKLDDALRELKDLAEDVHNLSHRLHSSKLQHLGLPAALREVCRQIGEQHRVEIDLQAAAPFPTLSEYVSLCFYRVAQEALNNAVKHSQSKRVQVHLHSTENRVRLLVRDFGIGFDPAMKSEGLGLATMQERLRMVGGTLSITSIPGKGTDLLAEAGPRGGRLVSVPQRVASERRASNGGSNGARSTAQDGVKTSTNQRDRLHRTLQEITARTVKLQALVRKIAP
jgi:signal transduction histidine kinase